jgi:hypothetical protein
MRLAFCEGLRNLRRSGAAAAKARRVKAQHLVLNAR